VLPCLAFYLAGQVDARHQGRAAVLARADQQAR
jgi:hypothetical protein